MAAQVKLNSRGVRDLLKSPGVQRDLHRRLEPALAAAQAAAPEVSGDYKRSLEIVDVSNPSRVVSRLVAKVSYAMSVEAKHGTLARSLDAADRSS